MTQTRVRITIDIEGKGRFQETRGIESVPEVDRFLANSRTTVLRHLGYDRMLPLTGPSFIDLEGES